MDSGKEGIVERKFVISKRLTCTVVQSQEYLSGSLNRSVHPNGRRLYMTPNSLFVAPSRVKNKATAMVFTLLVIFTLILTACGGGTTQQTTSKHILKVAAQSYDFAQSGFNPYNGHPNAGLGLVYETLYFVNVNGGAFTPMLATNYTWNSDNTQVTFNIRQNVKWNDGQPFSADDVAFTFNLMKQYPAADSANVWSYLSSVQATDSNTVVM